MPVEENDPREILKGLLKEVRYMAPPVGSVLMFAQYGLSYVDCCELKVEAEDDR